MRCWRRGPEERRRRRRMDEVLGKRSRVEDEEDEG